MLIEAGHSAISSNLSFLNLLDFYNFINEDNLITAISELFIDIDCILVMDPNNKHGFVSNVINTIQKKGGNPNITTTLLSIKNNEGYKSIKSLIQSGEFETIAPNGQYLRKVFCND